MTGLLIAVLGASLLGGVHCAGMCGPFALYAATRDGRVRARLLATYHAGRLTTYMLLGVLAGGGGLIADAGGSAVGLPRAATVVAGAALVLLALWQLGGRGEEPSKLGGIVAKAKPLIDRLPRSLRPWGVGAVTVLLPCGWLYAYLLVAASTGRPFAAVAVMAAFWIGTVPWLSGLTLLAKPLARVAPRATRFATAGLLLFAGLYTLTGRASADFRPLLDAAAAAGDVSCETLDAVSDVTPPCCRHRTEATP